MRRRVTAIVLQTLVLASLVAATAGLAVATQQVTLLLDGTPHVVTTQRHTVAGAGSYVVLRRGRQVTITIDGLPRRIWVTARSVEECELLALTHVTLGPTDRASLPLNTRLIDGLMVTVTRIRGTTGLVNLTTPPPVQHKKAVNPAGPYYGLYQFSAGTWHAVGGAGIPTDASPTEQTYRAQLLYERSGAGRWPVCGKNLFT